MSYRLLIKPEAELHLEDAYNWYEQNAIFYLVNQDNIAIIACFHAQRDPKYWQKRV